MAWEEVDLKGIRGEAKITLRKSGHIGFNGTLVKKFELKRFKFVKLLVDTDERKIGIKLLENGDELNTTPIIFKTGNVYVTAKPLFNTYDIDPRTAKAKNVKMDKTENMIIADIIKNE